jgi:hypothetical protein
MAEHFKINPGRAEDAQTIEDLRHALQWALSNVNDPSDDRSEYAEDYAGATRLAWPDQPEEWWPADNAAFDEEE